MRRPFKLPSNIVPRYYQETFLTTASDLIRSKPDTWHLFVSPTGTGKSIMEMMYLSTHPQAIMITPRLEIIAGMLEDLHYVTDDMTTEELVTTGWEYGIITPIRLRNMLARGQLDFMPHSLLIDECHHDLAGTYQDITMYLNGCPKLGLTASGFRGTPKQTEQFHNQWGNTINQVISLKDSIDEGFCSFPDAIMLPFVDDDLVDVANGEFRVRTTENLLIGSNDPLEPSPFDNLIRFLQPLFDKVSRLYDRPTMISVPGSVSASLLAKRLTAFNLPNAVITQDTSRSNRSAAFQACQCSTHILIQINVVSEGVNLPKLRRIIDLAPTMSPVKWVQQMGRMMRPVEQGECPPEYVCCCRNLERHGYLMEGMFPAKKIAEAQEAFKDEFGNPRYSKRAGTRVIGLEGLGKFTTTSIHLLDGTVGAMYNLTRMEGFQKTEFIVFVHPNHPQPLYGRKCSTRKSDGSMDYGRWVLIESIPDIQGCTTAKIWPLTEKQENRWKESAESYGLNPHRQVDTREFQILPFLRDTNVRFRH
jgi:superfamily II DNA or RNA helicase